MTIGEYLIAFMSFIIGLLGGWLSYQWENTLFLLAAIGLGFTRRAWLRGLVIGVWFVAIGIGWFSAVLRCSRGSRCRPEPAP